MKVILIVAHGKNLEIGKQGGLPWHLPGDLARFKAATMGHTLVMGRKTFESIGRPLPGRTSLVISRDSSKEKKFFPSLEAALDQAKKNGETIAFIAGGASIYKEALEKNLVDEMYVTEIESTCPEADVFFPEYRQDKNWILDSKSIFAADEKNPHSCVLKYYIRTYN
jgi:dihydrofolate reductase